MAEDLDLQLEQLGLELSGAAENSSAWLESLAQRLSILFPHHLQVRRGLFGRGAVQEVKLVLGEREYILELNHQQLQAKRAHRSGGVAIHSDELPLADWVSELFRDIASEAAKSAELEVALKDLIQPKI